MPAAFDPASTFDTASAFDRALAQHRQGRLDAAAAGYETVLGADPDHVPALCCLCLCRVQAGRLDEALRLGRRAVGLAAHAFEAWYGLGTAQMAQGTRHRDALLSLRNMLVLHPTFAEGYNNLGVTLGRLGRPAEAPAPLRRAVVLRPEYGEAWFNLGNALQAADRSAEATDCYRRALALDPTSAAGHANLGTVLALLGRTGQAIVAMQRARTLEPRSAPIHTGLGDMLDAANRPQEALLCYETARAIDPGSAAAHYGLGNVLAALRRHLEAIGCYRRALALRPDFAQAHNNLGNSLQGSGAPAEAIVHYRDAIALQPQEAKSYNNLGSALQAAERAEAAADCYRKATTLAPDYAEAHYNIGTALTDAGALDEAYRAFAKAVELAPRRGCFHRMLAETGRIVPGSPAWQRLEDLSRDIAALPEPDQMELHFALGKVYGDAAQPERAFRHLLAGNRLKRRGIAYDEVNTLGLFERIRTVFTASLLSCGPEIGVASPVPVFIVGMPRSGTTLIEQILASHPGIFGAGELRTMRRLAAALAPIGGVAFPEAVLLLPKARLHRLGADYLDALRRRAPSAARIVDKMPANFQLIGLIRLALPDARIVHVSRDPVDTCLSCFSKLFSGRQPFAYDLGELGRYYRAYAELMAHWRRVLPPGVMLEVRYEDVVADVEGQARRLLAHCGLAWNERCLSFHRTRRVVRTASATQVRQPLYGSSVGRWQVYGDLARPLLEALENTGGRA